MPSTAELYEGRDGRGNYAAALCLAGVTVVKELERHLGGDPYDLTVVGVDRVTYQRPGHWYLWLASGSPRPPLGDGRGWATATEACRAGGVRPPEGVP